MRCSIAAMRRSKAQIDAITEQLAKAQLPDGYLNCWYIGREIDKRWTNLRDNHELYCAGHMLEGAIAYFQATGRRRLLDIMLRYVDHIATVFGPDEGQKRGYCGHQEIELALIKLFHVTGERKHLDLAAYFINERGQPAALLRHRGAWRAATIRRNSGRGPTNTTSRTSRCASRQGRRPRGPRDVHVFGDGRSRRRARRRCAEARLRGAVEGRHLASGCT